MSTNQFNYSDVSPQVVNSKGKYREDPQNKKLTYNFVTDPRLRRGHNFGVIYVNSGMEETQEKKKMTAAEQQAFAQRMALRKAKERALYESQKNSNQIQKYIDFGIATEIVTTTEMPTPITFEVEVQTDPLPPKEQEQFPWPKQTGIEIGTQIEDTDLFNFDREVKPLVQILVSKTIEDSRREVLEEEEMEEMERERKKYEQLNKEDAERVKNIEEEERKRYEERLKKKEDKKRRYEMAKIFQKKLLSRTLSKSYLGKLYSNTIDVLGKRGEFKSEEVDDYFTVLLPSLMEIVEEEKNNDYKYSGGFLEMEAAKTKKQNNQTHQDAIRKEKERRQKEYEDYLAKKKAEEEEKERQKQERRRRRYERKIAELTKAIQEDLMTNSEWLEDMSNMKVFNINGYFQKEKCVTTLGGPIGQIVIATLILNKIVPKTVPESEVLNLFTNYIPDSLHSLDILYKQEDFEEYKTIKEDFNGFEDIKEWKSQPFVRNII
ncbi:MAG: hypothetical protein MJ252_25150 [archaeon]|nr:hypothetical protein [archaeon]